MLEGNFNVTRVRAVPRPLNIHIILVCTFKSNVNTIQCHLYNFIFMNENDIYKIQVHNLQFSLRLLIQC